MAKRPPGCRQLFLNVCTGIASLEKYLESEALAREAITVSPNDR